MKKLIDLDKNLLLKLKIIAAFEDTSVKALLENIVESYVIQKEKQRFEAMSKEEKEDLGLLLLMEQADKEETVSRKEIFDSLD